MSLAFVLSVNEAPVIMYKIGSLLVRGISLLAAQLFVIAIENILRGGGGLREENEKEERRNTINLSNQGAGAIGIERRQLIHIRRSNMFRWYVLT